MNLLHLDSSILGAHSVSRIVSADIVAHLQADATDPIVTYRDLAADPIPHLSGGYLAAGHNPDGNHAPDVQADLAIGAKVLEEFLAADTVVIGVAFYNFGISSQLKAWIDRILIAGKTFRYGADGRPEGFCGDKRVILGIARGGFYGAGTPTESFEHAETYLRTALGFIGVTQIEVVAAEGVAVPDRRAAAIESAKRQIESLAA